MGKNRKLVNNTNIPQHAIEHFTRCIFDDIIVAYQDEEVLKEFAAWQAEQGKKKLNIETVRATSTVALTVAIWYLLMAFCAFASLWDGTPSHIWGNKQIIRTHLPLERYGSDYSALCVDDKKDIFRHSC